MSGRPPSPPPEWRVPAVWLSWIPVLTRLLGLAGAGWEIFGVDLLRVERSWQAIALIGAMLGLGEFVQAFRTPTGDRDA